MKKTLGLILILILALGLIGCSDIGVSDELGVGNLVVSSDVEVDRGTEYDDYPDVENITGVVLRGDMNSWGVWDGNEDIELEEEETGVWVVPDKHLEKIEAEQEYQFLYITDGDPVGFMGNAEVKEDGEKLTFNYDQLMARYIDASEDTKVSIGDKEGSLGETINITNGEYTVTILDDIYGVQKEIPINADETTTIKLDEPLELAQSEVTFTFDPSKYDDYEDGMDVAIVGDPATWTDFGNSDYLLEKNEDGEYEITLTATAGDKYEFALADDWSQVGEEEWDGFTRVVPQDTEKTQEDDFGNEQGVVTFERAAN